MKPIKIIDIGTVKGLKYTKEQDPEGFHRYRIIGKATVDGIICQVTGYVTQIKEKNRTGE
jgi:hypothetical protein